MIKKPQPTTFKQRRSSLSSMPGAVGLQNLNRLLASQHYMRGLLSCNSRWSALWDAIVVVAALTVAVIAPFEVTFGKVADTGNLKTDIMLRVLLVTDAVFLLDIAKGFNTTYLSEAGIEVRERRKIMRRYLRGYFFFDCATSFPWTTAATLQRTAARELLLVSLVRVARLWLRSPLLGGKVFAVCKLGIALTLLTHWYACIYFAIVSSDESWHPSSDVILLTNVYHVDDINRYFVFLYYATVILVQGGELYPVPDRDTVVITLFELLGVLCFTLVFSKVSLIVQDSTSSGGAFRRKLEAVESASLELGLPGELHRKLINSVSQQADSFQLEWFVLAHSLPDSLFKEIIGSLLAPVSGISALKNFFDPRLEDKFLRLLKPCVCVPEEVLFHEFESGDCVYFLCRGCLQAELMCLGQTVFRITEGMMFGVSAAVSASHRVCYTATTCRSSLLFALTSQNLAELTHSVPRLSFHIKEQMQEENNFWLGKCLPFLKRLPYFSDCSLYDTLELAIATRAVSYESGTKIAQRGKPLPYIVMVLSGKLAITAKGNKHTCRLITMGPGSVYGVYTPAKATNIQRMNVVALEQSVCLLLSQQLVSELALTIHSFAGFTPSLFDLRRDDFLLSGEGRIDRWKKVKLAVTRILRGFYMRERVGSLRPDRKQNHAHRNGVIHLKQVQWQRLQDISKLQSSISSILSSAFSSHAHLFQRPSSRRESVVTPKSHSS